ncbi:MAG: beta-propeller fold lactonase family protein [Acidobacteriota bacterium]
MMRRGQAIPVLMPCLLVAAVGAAASEGHQKLYVLHSNADDMSVVDVATNRLIKTIQVGELPHGIASPRSQDVLYVATEGDNSLTVVDPVKDEVVRKYPIFGVRPNEIEVTSDGRYIYVPALGDGVYEVFDTVEEKIIARIPTDGFPHNVVVSPDDRYMYLSPMDRGRREAETVAKRGLPTSLNKKIYIVETKTHSVVGTIPTENTPRPIAVSPDGTRLYVNTDDFLGFLVLDLPGGKVLSRAEYDLTAEEKATPSRSHGIGVTPDQREVWSTDINHGLVHVFDVTVDPPRQIARLKTGRTPLWLTMTPDGKTVYVANTADDTLSVFDRATKKEKTRIQLEKGKAPKRMLVLTVPEGPRTP